jgi:Flp pilus assembly pilin Flp
MIRKSAIRAWRRFVDDESGAVTVDWVVLTGTIVGLTIAVIATLGGAFAPNAQNIGTELEEYTIQTSFN